MNENPEKVDNSANVNYELALTVEEAGAGAHKLLPRNNKRLQVNIPAGVVTGSVVKLTNALQITDGRAGDILVHIKVKTAEPSVQEMTAGVVEINDNNFEHEVLESSLPVVVDFWAPWCGHCRVMAPVIDKIATQYQGKFKVCKINVDENLGMAGQYHAASIPTLIFFHKGQVVDKNVGAMSENDLRIKLNSLLKSQGITPE